MMIDTFYYFDKSTKRKNELVGYCTFCDLEFRQVLKHVSTRWLSLELTINRTLQQYHALQSYFLSEGMSEYMLNFLMFNIPSSSEDSSARFDRLRRVYANPMSEVFLMFYHAALQLFINFNKFLQREDPIICVILSQIKSFLKKLFGRFVTVAAIREAQADISSLDYQNRDNQLSGREACVVQ